MAPGVNSKTAQGNDAASGPFGTAVGGVNRWNGTGANLRRQLLVTRHLVRSNRRSARSKNGTLLIVVHTIQTWCTQLCYQKVRTCQWTNYHTGGPMIVNDQKGPMFREMVPQARCRSYRSVVTYQSIPWDQKSYGLVKQPGCLTATTQYANGTLTLYRYYLAYGLNQSRVWHLVVCRLN